ncbi:synaptophysin-like [Limulus polyphemus]|uniref:Synaptophysin-like n=1 Tax=Limulus polyphemus TaxID=6850 RepID=A0ABM1B5P4_LIMPO|nr:synaptophysin-like [Limulus polyphemus]
MDINFRVLKEPLGFIRTIQIVIAIFAFATTSGFGSKSSFRVKCMTSEKETDINYEYGYPFRLRYSNFIVPKCDGTYDTTTEKIPYDFSSSAEFFVTTGVLTFMYSLGITLFYIFAHQKYIDDQVVPITDLGITGILTIFWLAGSSAWAQGVSDMKYYTSPVTLAKNLEVCSTLATCETTFEGNYATLNVSLIFGFANCLLWASSLWFVYKETVFHYQRQELLKQLPPQYPQSYPQTQSPGMDMQFQY